MRKASWLYLALYALAAFRAITPCLAETSTKGTISGRVLTANGEPLRRATVALEEVKYSDGSTETVGDTTTGNEGEFSFSDLTPARYRLEAEKSGYVAGHFPRSKALVRIASGDDISEVTLRLVPVSVVSGSVLDGNGEPLAKAVVRLLHYKYFPGGRRLAVAREAIADERGEYRIGDLNPGRYYAVASYHSRISDVVCPPVYYPDVASFDDAIPIRILPNDETPIKFVLVPGKPFRVRGNLVGWSGNTRVSLIPRDGVPYAQSLSVETSNGSFQFKSVLPGDYIVMASSQGTDEILEGRATLTLVDHEIENVSVRLVRRMEHKRLWVSIDSAPRFLSTEDVVISLRRPTVSPEDSTLLEEDDSSGDAHEISTRAGNPIELPYPGPFVVSAEKLPGDSYVERADFQGESYPGPQMRGTEHLVVHLNSRGASLEGIVLDGTDQPLPGAVVVAFPRRGASEGADQSRVTTTDQYGQFALHGLANTAYDIYAWDDVPDGAYYDPEFLADFADGAVGMSISSGTHYQVKLHAASANEE